MGGGKTCGREKEGKPVVERGMVKGGKIVCGKPFGGGGKEPHRPRTSETQGDGETGGRGGGSRGKEGRREGRVGERTKKTSTWSETGKGGG